MEKHNNITWASLPMVLKEIAINQDNSDYSSVRSNYFKVGHPELVLMAKTDEHVAEAVRYATEVQQSTKLKIPVSVRSGGHGITNYSINDGGIIIDLSQMNRVHILDEKKGTVQVQAGAVWGDVAHKISQANLILSSGDFGDTGVGGLATSGGIGLLVRKQGLTIDRILSATVITADGKKHIATDKQDTDLFWAIRGGSSQVGIVTEFVFQADWVNPTKTGIKTPISLQKITYDIAKLSEFLPRWHSWILDCNENISSLLMLTKNTDDKNSILVETTNIWCGENSEYTESYFTDALTIGKIEKHNEKSLAYDQLVEAPHLPHKGDNQVYVKNVLLNKLDGNLFIALNKLLEFSAVMGVEVRAVDGPINKRPRDFNAWPFRDATLFVAVWGDASKFNELNQLFEVIQAQGMGVYGAYSSDISQQETARVWPGDTGNKLRNIVHKYDPQHIINQSRYA